MKSRQKITMFMLLLFIVAFLTATGVSLCQAQIYLSTDIPVDIGGSSYDERDIISFKNSAFSLYRSGSTYLGVSAGVNIVAFGLSGGDILFSVDVPTDLGGNSYTERDLISYNGSTYAKLLDGVAAGIPEGARIDAATVLGDGSIVFSLDVTAELEGITYDYRDLIRYSASTFSLYFDGPSKGIPEGVDIDGVWVNSYEDILFSLDVTTDIGSLEVADSDIIKWDHSTFSLYFDGDSSGIPEGANLDAFAEMIVAGKAMPWLLLLLLND
jgi:hypothetical protein